MDADEANTKLHFHPVNTRSLTSQDSAALGTAQLACCSENVTSRAAGDADGEGDAIHAFPSGSAARLWISEIACCWISESSPKPSSHFTSGSRRNQLICRLA